MTEREKMNSGQLYDPADAELTLLRTHARSEAARFNSGQGFERLGILYDLFGAAGKGLHVEPNFWCDYGFNIHVGNHFYANFDCIILDVCRVDIGHNCFLGPRVCIYTAEHPLPAAARRTGLEYGKPVAIGNDVWIGGSAVVRPGVTIGDGAVVAAGSVVVQNVPPGVLVAGNPARVVKKIPEQGEMDHDEA